jgi:bacterioferritin (cytochrome b1)
MPTVDSKTRAIELLNQLLAVECYSFPMYLSYAAPWTHHGDERATEALSNITADQQAMAQRIADLIDRLGGRPQSGEYPMEFTDTHFLSLDYLLKELACYQRQDLAAVETIARQLGDEREARELAEETLGMERAHLEAIEALGSQLDERSSMRTASVLPNDR